MSLANLLLAAISQAPPVSLPAESARGFVVSPLRLEKPFRPGTPLTLTVNIENREANPIRVRTTAASARVADKDYNFAAGSHDRDCRPWLDASIAPVQIPPFGSGMVSIKVTPPRSSALRGPFWCTLNVTTDRILLGQPVPSGIAIQVPIVLTTGSAIRPDLSFQSPEVTALKGNTLVQAEVKIVNDGHAVINATAVIRGLGSGRSVFQQQLRGRHIFPKLSRRFNWSVGRSLPDGRYAALVEFDLKGRRLRTAPTLFGVRGGKTIRESDPVFLTIPPVSFQPTGIIETLAAKGSKSVAVQISNSSDRTISLRLGIKAVGQTEQGSLDVLNEAIGQGFTAVLSQPQLKLSPRGSARLRLDLKVDAAAKGERWFALTATEETGASALSEPMFGSLTVEGTESPGLSLTPINWVAPSGRPTMFKFYIINTGNLAMSPVGQAVLTKDGTGTGIRLSTPSLPAGGLLPKAKVLLEQLVPGNLAPGKYTLSLSFLYGRTPAGQPLTANLQSKVTVGGKK